MKRLDQKNLFSFHISLLNFRFFSSLSVMPSLPSLLQWERRWHLIQVSSKFWRLSYFSNAICSILNVVWHKRCDSTNQTIVPYKGMKTDLIIKECTGALITIFFHMPSRNYIFMHTSKYWTKVSDTVVWKELFWASKTDASNTSKTVIQSSLLLKFLIFFLRFCHSLVYHHL